MNENKTRYAWTKIRVIARSRWLSGTPVAQESVTLMLKKMLNINHY
jgi:hypothetical protein